MLRFSCEHCGAPYRVADGAAGKLATCQKCGQKIRVPLADNSDSPGVPAGTLTRPYGPPSPVKGEEFVAPTAQAGSADAMADLLAALSTAQRPAAAAPPAAKADVPAPAPQAVPAAPVSPVIPVVAAPQADVSAAAAQADTVAAGMELGPAAAAPQGENTGQVFVEPGRQRVPPDVPMAPPAEPPDVPMAPPAEPPDVPMARLAEPDGIPLAKPVRSKAPLLIGLGVIALVVLAVGLGLVLLQPAAYDLENLKASYRQAQALADNALSAAPDAAGQPDSEIIASLDEKALVSAKDALKVALDTFKAISQLLAKLKQHKAGGAALKELADSTDLQIEIASTRLKAVEDELWPRPGDVADMYSRMKASVSLIEGHTTFEGHEGKSVASGFLIKPAGLGYLVVTNRHVVDDAPNGYAVRFLPEGKSAKDQSDDIKLSPKDVVHIHRNEDLAILKLPSEAGKIIEKLNVRPLKVAKDLKVGRPVWVVGNPGAGAEGILAQSLVKGDVSFIKEDALGDPTLFRLTAPINKGNSGGPVLDKDGRVVGIVSRMIQGKSEMNFAVHFHKLQELIDLMSGKIDSPDLIALNAEEVRRVVVPRQQLTADLEAAVAPWKAKGFNRRQWQGKGRDANSYFIMPALRPEAPIVMPVIVRKFTAKKGNTYGIVSVSGKTGDFDIEVYYGSADSEPRTRRKGRPESRPEIKPVFIRQASGTSKAIGLKGEEFRQDFVADKDGAYEVRFVKSVRQKELEGSVLEPIHICACVVELTGVQWKPAESQEAPK